MTRRQARPQPTYSKIDLLLASPIKPIPDHLRLHQLTMMWQGLRSIETAAEPTTNDWRVISDAVNLMETLVTQGIVEDGSGLLADAIAALAMAGQRHVAGGHIRLDAKGIQAVRAVLEDYAELIATLPHRTMVRCHRDTEARIRDIMAGKRMPHDVTVMAL